MLLFTLLFIYRWTNHDVIIIIMCVHICRSSTVQLRSRHWKVLDSNGKLITEVAKGARGVVGCTPILKPNTCFSYYSGTDMDLDGGRMYGSFEMLVLDSKGTPIDSFDAEIATFNFINPSHEEK